MNRPSREANNNQEVEIRALLNNQQRSTLGVEFSDRGAKLEERMDIVDMYLCPVAVRSFQDIEMHKVGSVNLRIREQTTNG